jgi:hypothetical protein
MARKDYPRPGARDTQQREGVGLGTVCGAHSALGLDEVERVAWPHLRDRLRQPGRLMALMRGVLGGDAEVAVVAAVTPEGIATPLAVLVSPALAAELVLDPPRAGTDVRTAHLGEYEVELLTVDDAPVAVLMTPWLFENLSVYSRKLWSRRRR